MKKTIYILAISIFISGGMLSSCQSSPEKIENAENELQQANENVLEAEQNLSETREDSIIEYQKFKTE